MSITNIASNTSARVAAGVLGVAMALSLSFGAVVAPAQAQDASVIAALQAQINTLLAQLAALSGGSTPAAGVCPYTWTRNLEQGATGADVMKLQQFLNASADTRVSATGAGSPGSETQTFGPATKAAVMKYQAKNSIAPVAGYVGALTRASLNSKCQTATPTTPTTPSTGTGLMVSAAAQPANALAVGGASRVPFTKFTLTAGNDGDVTVNSVVVSRTGVMNKVVFSGVVLLDDMGNIVGTDKVLNSNDQATIGTTMVIPRGTSKTFTVAGNMASLSTLNSHTGEIGGLSVVGVNTSATVTGSLPIMGATHTINGTLVIGTADVTISSFDPNGAQSKEIGTTGQRFAGVRVTAGSAEDVRIKSVRWYQTGSAGSSDLSNVKTVVDGTEYNTTVSSDGKYYEASFGSGIVVAKGFSAEIYIKGDIVGSGSTNRTVIFNLDKVTDLYITGEKYGYGISPTTSASATSATTGTEFTSAAGTTNPWFSGSQFTITGGSATSISKANEVAAQNIAVNVQNQVLGGFVTDFKGEPVTVQSMIFDFATSSSAGNSTNWDDMLLTSVSLVNQNGSVVAGPVDAVDGTAGDNKQQVTFTDSVTFPVGKQIYTVKGKVHSSTPNGTTILASTSPSAWSNVKGETTGNSVTLSIGGFFMNTMTVKGAALAISISSTPSAQSIVAGVQDFTFSKIQLDATQSGEDVRFSSIPLELTHSAGSTQLTNCQLFDGATALNTGSNNVNPNVATGAAATFTLDNSLVISKGTVKTLDLKCDVSGSATGNFSWGIDASPSITVTGVNSNVDVTESVTASTGQLMTVQSGSLAVSLDSSSPSYKMVPAGSTDVVVGAYKFRPSNEDVNLRRIGLKLTNSASSSSSDLVRVTLWAGSTQIGAATFTGSNVNATSTNASGTGDMSYVLPKDTDTIITVKADLAQIGTNQPATSGHLVKIDVDANSTGNTQGTGVGSGATIDASGTTAVAGVRLFKSVPTITYSTTGTTLTGGVNELMVINVAADAKGEVQLEKLTFNISTTTASVTAFTFSGPNGNVASSSNVNFSGSTGSQTIRVFFDSTSNTSDAVISAGQSKTYTLRGTVTTGSGGNTVSTSLDADSAFPALDASTFMASTTALGIAGSSIIWSPSSTTTVGTTGNDWTNGYGLPGCFSTSGLGNDCTPRVLFVNI